MLLNILQVINITSQKLPLFIEQEKVEANYWKRKRKDLLRKN